MFKKRKCALPKLYQVLDTLSGSSNVYVDLPGEVTLFRPDRAFVTRYYDDYVVKIYNEYHGSVCDIVLVVGDCDTLEV